MPAKGILPSPRKHTANRNILKLDIHAGKYTHTHTENAHCIKCYSYEFKTTEPRQDNTNKMTVRPAKTQISLSLRCPAWRNLGSLATHWVHSEDSDQTGWMLRLIWLFAGRTPILLVLSCCGSRFCIPTGISAQLTGARKCNMFGMKLLNVPMTCWH